MEDPDGQWRKYNNLSSDTYGTIVEKSDKEFSDRKKRAYLYLYKDDESRVSTIHLANSSKKVSKAAAEVQDNDEILDDETFPL